MKTMGDDMKWLPWMRGYGRCPYCTGLKDGDWLAICDCWMAERTVSQKVLDAPWLYWEPIEGEVIAP